MILRNLYERVRFGFPTPGPITRHKRLSYPFEQGGEFSERFSAAFGDPSGLVAVDLGCGPGDSHISNQIMGMPWKRLISVEAFHPYAERMRQRPCGAAEWELVEERAEAIFKRIPEKVVDVAIMVDVLEHFSRSEAIKLLIRLEKWVNQGVVLFLPLGNVEQAEYDGNPLQEHKSHWNAEDLAGFGFEVTVYEGLHGQLEPPADAGWAIKKLGNRVERFRGKGLE